MPYDALRRSYTEPFRDETVDLPIEVPRDEPSRVRVHVELGIPIYFSPTTRAFTARLSPVSGRGAAMTLAAKDFDTLVGRIRKRALVVPVEAYTIETNPGATDEDDVVRVVPVLVIEHHIRRDQPYVVRLAETDRRSGLPVSRIRPMRELYLPQPSHVERLRAAYRAIREEDARHKAARAALLRAAHDAMDAVPLLEPEQIKYVQESDTQVAASHASVGAVVFDAEADDEDIDEEGAGHE